jgi:hypothetical protein
MPYFLDTYLDGMTEQDFFQTFGLGGIRWTVPLAPNSARGEYYASDPTAQVITKGQIVSDNWRLETKSLPDPQFTTVRHTIHTPGGELTMVLQANEYTSWVKEPLLKEKQDLDVIMRWSTSPLCDAAAVRGASETWGDRGIVRGWVLPFDIYGQPGCWQDFCCLRGTEQAIMDTFDDPAWVHQALAFLRDRKQVFVRSMAGSGYDLVELGGGDASTAVISPTLFREFVQPYDAVLVAAAREAGIRIVYHTCGGMMPILEDIADMGPAAMETFTPPDMGGDSDLRQAKLRIGNRVCMIGGFDQGHGFQGCSTDETRAMVRRCFEQAGSGNGFIISPSDHFFDADPELIRAFADEARSCVY